jgi:hypothetical protein
MFRHDGWQDLEADRYDAQKTFPRIANSAGRLLGTAFTKAGQGVGYLGALGFETARGLFDGVDTEGNAVSRAVDNGFSAFFAEMEEGLKETLPIFKPSGYENRSVAEKLFSSGLSFYLDEAVDGMAFVLSNYIPGGALKALGSGAKLAKAYQGAFYSAKSGRDLGSAALRRIADRMDLLTTGTTMTAMESMFEAKDVKDQVRDKLRGSRSFTEEEIEAIASQRAADAFALNMTFLAPSNALELGAVFGAFSKGAKHANAASRNAKGIKRTGKEITSSTQDVARAVEPHWTSPVGKILGNAAAEGLYEENIQYTISSLASYVDPNMSKNELLNQGYMDAFNNLLNNAYTMADLKDQQRLESVALGTMIGGGMAAGSAIPGISHLNKALGGDGGPIAAYKEAKELARGNAVKANASIKSALTADI